MSNCKRIVKWGNNQRAMSNAKNATTVDKP